MGGNIVDVPNTASKRRRRSSHVRFKEEEEIINPGTDGLYDVATLNSLYVSTSHPMGYGGIMFLTFVCMCIRTFSDWDFTLHRF